MTTVATTIELPHREIANARTSIRIALRQMKAARHASPVLPAWLASFDQAGSETDADDAALHHDC